MRLAPIAAAALLAGLSVPIGSVPIRAQDGEALAPSSGGESAGERGDEIVVTGQREAERRREVHRQARDIAVTGNIFDDPLARFEARLCPGIVGLETEAAGYMIDRLRANARDLGLRVLDDGCTPNFLVVFTRDGQQMMGELRESSGHLFRFMDAGDKRALFDETGPVRVWTNIQRRTRDGMPVANTRDLVNPPVARMDMAHSKIYTPTRNDIESAMVVFDADAVSGMTLLQLADYATMRGLAQTRPAEEGMPVGTILALFEDEASPPDSLTRFDRAYLRAVYDWIPNLPAATKLGSVNRQLRILADRAEDED